MKEVNTTCANCGLATRGVFPDDTKLSKMAWCNKLECKLRILIKEGSDWRRFIGPHELSEAMLLVKSIQGEYETP